MSKSDYPTDSGGGSPEGAAGPDVLAAATELVAARQAVRDEMCVFARQGELRQNKQAPSWGRYDKAQQVWAELPDVLASAPPPAGEREEAEEYEALVRNVDRRIAGFYCEHLNDPMRRVLVEEIIAAVRASRSSTPGPSSSEEISQEITRLRRQLQEQIDDKHRILREYETKLGSTPESGTEPPCDHGTKRPGPDDWKYLDSMVHGAAGVRVCRVCGVKQAQKWVDVAALAQSGGETPGQED
jgi:hypothetical protein